MGAPFPFLRMRYSKWAGMFHSGTKPKRRSSLRSYNLLVFPHPEHSALPLRRGLIFATRTGPELRGSSQQAEYTNI